MLSTAQLELLDTYCGADQLALRAGVRDAYERVRELDRRATELAELAGARDRELDLLSFELDEIDAADPGMGNPSAGRRARPPAPSGGADRRRRAAAESIAPEAGTGAAELLAGAASAWRRPPKSILTCANWRRGWRRCSTRARTSAPSCAPT